MTDDQPRTAHVDVPMDARLWAQLHEGPTPDTAGATQRLGAHGLDELRSRHRYSEVEVDFVQRDALYWSSCREQYLAALDQFKRRRRLPGHARIEFHPPATRERRGWLGG